METEKKLKICGSITKKESLTRFSGETLENTVVAEAHQPYLSYYGRVPENAKPNSLFLFTENYYTLEEVIRFTQSIGICAKNKVNVASAVLQFRHQKCPAIRIRNFPDYRNVKKLQECYLSQGIRFSQKVNLENDALIKVDKCFYLQDAGNGFYFDLQEKNEGYFEVPGYLKQNEFEEVLQKIRNNSNCSYFDAAKGAFIIDAHVTDIFRIYSGHINLDMLKCIREAALKWMTGITVQPA
jgi:hypothetical protein